MRYRLGPLPEADRRLVASRGWLRRAVLVVLMITMSMSAALVSAASERDRSSPFRRGPTGLDVPIRTARGTVSAERRSDVGRAATPTPSNGFEAIRRIGGHWPADPTGALGEQWILTAANSSYALYDRTGAAVIGPNPLATLLSTPTRAEVFDPKVVYDQYRGRFILAYLVVDEGQRRSWISIITIPDATATDASTWCATRIVADRTAGDGKQFADYTGLGYDERHVVVTTNIYDFADHRFRGATVLAFAKGRLYDCGRTVAFDTFTGAETRNPSGTPGFTVQPASTVGTGGPLYLTSFDPGRPNYVVLWRLDERGGQTVLRNVAMRVASVHVAGFATQGGGDVDHRDTWWDPGDLRFVSTFTDLGLGSVFTAHVIGHDLRPDLGRPYAEAAIRWYEIRPTPILQATRVVRTGTIGAPETDAGWPALATDQAGDLFVTYSRASAITYEFLSAWVAEIEPNTNLETTTQLASGTARLEAVKGPERWGDYAALSRDPLDGRFLLAVNQVAVADGEGPTRDWRQIVQTVTHGP